MRMPVIQTCTQYCTNKLGLSCAKLRSASLLSLLHLVNSELCKCEKRSILTEVNVVKLFKESSGNKVVKLKLFSGVIHVK